MRRNRYADTDEIIQHDCQTFRAYGDEPWFELEDDGGNKGRMRITAAGSLQFQVDTGSGWVDAGIGGGSFSGPSSSTDNAIVRFDGTDGATGQNSIPTIDDDGRIHATSLNIGRVANNTVTGTYASVTSGQYNTAAGDYSTAAGDENEANGDYSGTLSGEDSVNDGPHSVIAGGSHNTISTGSYDAILGGWANNINGTTGGNVVCGGLNNDINGTRRNFMGGGYNNEISAQEYNTLVGGSTNEVSGTHSFIGGGGSNLASSNTGGVGWGNSNVCSGERAGVVCGTSNTASDKWTFIGGGTLNIASQDNAAICGGRGNTSTDYGTFVGGGYDNDATNDHASICGGELNVASGFWSHIGGGHSNTASGANACVPGGLSNTAATAYSTAIGTEAVTRNKGELTQSAGSFSTAGDSQVRRLHLRRQTTDATPTILTDDNAADSAGSWNCAYKTLQHYKVTVLGHRDNDTEFASFTMEGTVHREDGQPPESLWSSIESWVQTSAAWDSYVSVGSGGIQLYVVGEASKNINWSASVELVESTVS